MLVVTLLVGEKLCRVNNNNNYNIMFEYFDRDSDYTTVIAILY